MQQIDIKKGLEANGYKVLSIDWYIYHEDSSTYIYAQTDKGQVEVYLSCNDGGILTAGVTIWGDSDDEPEIEFKL